MIRGGAHERPFAAVARGRRAAFFHLAAAAIVLCGGMDATVAVAEEDRDARPPDDAFIAESAPGAALSADLIGRPVVIKRQQRIGVVDALVLDADGKVVGIVVETGSFLGVGGRKIGLSPEVVQFMGRPDGPRIAFVNMTNAQIEAAPDFVARETIEFDLRGDPPDPARRPSDTFSN